MPPSVTAPENPLVAPAKVWRSSRQTASFSQAPGNSPTPRGFNAGGLPGDLHLPGLNDPDPCIAPCARNRRKANSRDDDEEKHW
jgi:hypothetical protein